MAEIRLSHSGGGIDLCFDCSHIGVGYHAIGSYIAHQHVHSGNKTNGPSILNPSKIEGNLKVLWRIFLALGDVQATRPGYQPPSPLRALCAVAALAAVGVAALVVLRTFAAGRNPTRYAPSRVPWVAYWTSGTLLLLAAYLVNGYATLEPQFEAGVCRRSAAGVAR